MKPDYKELEAKIALLEVQLKLSEAAERAWESSMMRACGEDGPKSVADKFAALEAKCAELAAENVVLKKAAEFATAPDMWIEQADGMLGYRYCEWYVDVLKDAMETPATDAFLAEVRASARNDFIGRIEWIIRNECNPEKTEAIINELQNFSDELKLEAAQ